MRISSTLLLLTAGSLSLSSPVPNTVSDGSDPTTQVDRQITGPLLDIGDPITSVSLGQYTFNNSWGAPYVTTYTPPDVTFNQVRITLQVSSSGIQYDRLARLYVGGAEVWRSSTAEPTGGAMSYSYTKDVSTYVSLFQSSQNVVFDLGNTVNSDYTGAYWTQLTVDFYNVTFINNATDSIFDSYSSRAPATNILPIRPKSELTSTAYCYTLPSESIDFEIGEIPRNTTRVVLDVFASGNGDDEFWYYNMQPQNTEVFESNGLALSGNYPSRFIEVYINNDTAGLVLPFPVIFTGGLAPGLWIPNVGINAFDLPSYPIDLTPLLPKLWEGASIQISITTGFGALATSDWYVNANLLTWQNEGIKGSGTVVQGTNVNNTNSFTSTSGSESLKELLSITRDISTQAILNFTSTDGSTDSAFVKSSQTLSYTNTKNFYDGGDSRQVAQVSSGHCMLHVSKAGADLTKYANGIDSDTIPSDFSLVFDDTDSNSGLDLKTEWSYIYPLAINDASSNTTSQTDIHHGYLFSDPKTFNVWTFQNTSIGSDGTPEATQYLAQCLVGLDIDTYSTYEEYAATSDYYQYLDTVDSPSINNVNGFGKTNTVTTSVSNAANVAYLQKSDTAAITAAIQSVFDTILPTISLKKREQEDEQGEEEVEEDTLLGNVKRAVKSIGLGRSPFSRSERLAKRRTIDLTGLGRNPFRHNS